MSEVKIAKQTERMKMVIAKQLGAILIAGTVLLGGCAKDGENSPNGGGESTPSVFDFSTKATHTLNVKYDVPVGYSVYFEVYAENPLMEVADGEHVQLVKKELNPIDVGYTNDKGVYSNKLTLPRYVKEVFIYSPNAGVTKLLKATIENGVLSDAKYPESTTKASTKAATRAGSMGTLVEKTNFGPNIKTAVLSKWHHCNIEEFYDFSSTGSSIFLNNAEVKIWGRPSEMRYTDKQYFPGTEEDAQPLSATVWNTINSTLPGKEVTPDKIADILANGDIEVSEEGEIDIFMQDNRGEYVNVLAYYCYDTANPPKNRSDIKQQVVAFSCAKLLNRNYQLNGFVDYGAFRPGEGIRLNYIDQDGVNHGTKFPAGVSIGWILYANGYNFRNGVPAIGRSAIYSNESLNNNMPHTALFRHNDTVILSFEDQPKATANDTRDYDDIIFSLKSTPASAITPGIPDKDPAPKDDKEVTAVATYQGILLFEDIWPYRGDFDMNDVVIRYISRVGYNHKNEVIETIEEFTPLHSGAQRNNSFAYQNVNLSGDATVTIEGGDGAGRVDTGDKTIIRLANKILDYANLTEKKIFKVTTKFNTGIAKENFVLPPYNPFITVKGEVDYEVHLTNMAPTSYADVKKLGTGHDISNPEKGIYYATFNEQNEQMPFAIDMLFSTDKQMIAFVIPAEKMNINTHYSGFMKWILSGGKDNQDWYLHPSK